MWSDQVMPYASGPSVRRLSKIATLLLARNYIVMLQRTVDELRHLLVPAVHSSGVGDRTEGTPSAPPSPQRTDSAPASRDLAAGRLPPPAAAAAPPLLAMTSLPAAAMLNERLRSSHLQSAARQRVGGAADWSAAVAAVRW